MSHEVHVVTGLPCAGKSTLCRGLASSLGGTAIVVGDLIRVARGWDTGSRARSQNAYDGNEEYPADWIASLLRPALASAQSPVVIDGAVPLDVVLPRLGITATSLLVLQASEQARFRRFEIRRASSARPDDAERIFHRRTEFHQRTLLRMRALIGADKTFVISGDVSSPAVLRQALSAITVARHASMRPRIEDTGKRGSGSSSAKIADLATEARRRRCVVRSVWVNEGSDSPDPVLLLKPFHDLSPAMLDAILSRFAVAGFIPGGATVWPCSVIEAARAMPVHLEMHYAYARWGLLGDNVALDSRVGEAFPAYRLISSGRSPRDLSLWWHSDPKPQKLARSLWLKQDAHSRVVNGHIPALIESWHRRSFFVAAIRLVRRSNAVSWRELRTEVLGSADPAEASRSSVRGAAYAGLLPDVGEVSLADNLVHLSAGPLEAIRERWLWMGESQRGTDVIDHPTSSGTWSYEATENVDPS